MKIQDLKVGGLYQWRHTLQPSRLVDLLPANKGHVSIQLLTYRVDGQYAGEELDAPTRTVTSRSLTQEFAAVEPEARRIHMDRQHKIDHAEKLKELWVHQNTGRFDRVIELLKDSGVQDGERPQYQDYVAQRRWDDRQRIINRVVDGHREPGQSYGTFNFTFEELDTIARMHQEDQLRIQTLTNDLIRLKYSQPKGNE